MITKSFDGLREAVARLAASATVQRAYLQELGVVPSADELGLEFDDALAPVRHQLHGEAAAALRILDELLSEMDETLWSTNALEDQAWQRVRETAETAKRALANT